MFEWLDYFTKPVFFESLIIIVVMMLLLAFIKKYLIKKVAYTTKDEQHFNTFIGVIFSLLQYVVILVAIVIIMKINGVNISSIFTGLGILATIVGLSLQDTLKDLFSGINIYNNNFYKVGDVVKYNGENCEVKYFNARVTKFVSLATGSTYTVCNSNISAIEKIKSGASWGVTFPLDVPKDKVDAAFNRIAERSSQLESIKNVFYFGAINLDEKGVRYLLCFDSPAKIQGMKKIEIAQIAVDEFNKEGIKPIFQEKVQVEMAQ